MWNFFFLGLGLSALIVAVLELMVGDLIPFFFGEEFTDATAIAQILLLASLFVAGRRVLTDGVNGLGYPGYGTIAEVTSWILLLPGLAILLPWFGAEGVALALAISWGASLLLLILLALAADRTTGALPARLTEAMRRLAAFPRRLQAQQVFGFAGAALLAAARRAGCGVLSEGRSWAGHRAVGRPRSSPLGAEHSPNTLDRSSDAWPLVATRRLELISSRMTRPVQDSTVPRRLYYGGVLLLGLITLRAAGQVTISDLFFLASFLLACAEFVVLRRRVPVKLPFLLLIGVALFSLGGLLSTFESYQTLHSIAVIARLVFLTVFWFWLGTVVLRRQEHITTAISCWVLSAAICGGGAIVQLLVGDVIPNASIDGGRATGFTAQPNDLGALTAIAFVPALMLASRPRIAAATRAWFFVLLLLVAAGLILSASVGAVMAAGVATAVWLTFQRISKHVLLTFAVLVICVAALLTLQSIRGAPSPLDRLQSATTNSSLPGGGTQLGSVDQRIRTYRVAVARIKEDPFIGVGLDLFSVTRPFGVEAYEYDVHNLVIGLWYKTGLVGLAGMLIALLAILRAAWTAISRATSNSEWTVAVTLASWVVAFIVFAMTAPILFTRLGWISAAMVLAFRGVQQESPAAVEPAAEPRAGLTHAPALANTN